jgi:hypothetical protein
MNVKKNEIENELDRGFTVYNRGFTAKHNLAKKNEILEIFI